ncbi:MAG: efflux RND transporter permease subunit [Candidatus Omnitrophica bacterium]|nr:efflux RND transporter permease subunit [Candidatus Omnitrophota bacterium]
MSLPEVSIRRPVTTLMVYLGVILFGVISLELLSRELFPPINYPQLSIVTPYENAAPEEIETLITKPIEEAVGGISGLREVTSTSKEGLSVVVAEFAWNQNMDFASLAVREKIDLIKERLPRDAAEPVVIKFNPFDLPVLSVSISSAERTPVQLREIARRWFKDEIEKIQGVASASLSGGAEEQILVDVDQAKLRGAGLSIVEVSEALGAANLNYPGGTIKESFYEYLVRTLGEFKHIHEVGQIPVKRESLRGESEGLESLAAEREPSNRLVLLKDIADVRRGMKDRTSFSRHNFTDNVTIAIQKQAQASTVAVTKAVKRKLKELRETLPKDIRIDIVSDQSKAINNALDGVRDAALQGGVLAYFVLVFFLMDFKNSALIITITPVTVLATFTLMYFMKISLNVISLGGIALGVGMLLDNAVVVMENVYRIRGRDSEGGLARAAVIGAQEMMAPMTASTLANVFVFLPVVFVSGIAGQLFKELAWVIVVTQIVSAVIAFTLLPMLISKSGEKNAFRQRDISAIENFYLKVLGAFTRRKGPGFLAVFLLFLAGVSVILSMDRVLLPKVEQGEFTVKVDLPVGARVDFTDQISRKVEKFVSNISYVQTVSSVVGSSKGDSTKEVVERLGAHEAQITVTMKPEYKKYAPQVVQALRQFFELSKGRQIIYPARLSYILNESAFGVTAGGDAPIVVEIKGKKLEELKAIALEVQRQIAKIDGLYGVSNSIADPFPETKVVVNKDRAAYYKLSVVNIAQAANIAMKGVTASKFKEEGREIDIRVQLKKTDRDALRKISGLVIHSPLDVDVPLGDFVRIVRGRGPSEIKRVGQERTVQVFAKVYKKELRTAIEEAQQRLALVKMPAGYDARIAGESREIKESFRNLLFALGLSVILIYMVMAAQFESLWQPLIIMFCLPLSLIGVSVSLFLFHTPVSVVVILGIILLGGIVVNNGIILIDTINQLRGQGVGLEDAVMQAGKSRLRPILMTAFSSAAGAVPLAFATGEGAIQAPLGVTAIGGILVATFLTLVVIPAIYLGVEKLATSLRA